MTAFRHWFCLLWTQFICQIPAHIKIRRKTLQCC